MLADAIETGVSPGLLTTSRLIHEESEWRRPDVLMGDHDFAGRTVVSRWTDLACERQTVSADIRGAYHTVAVALRPTEVTLGVAGHRVHEGRVASGMMQVSGPMQRTTAAFRAPCDMLHLHVGSDTLRACYEELEDRPAPGEIAIDHAGFSRDPVVARLSEVLLEAEGTRERIPPMFADSVSIAIVTRLLAIATRRSPPSSARVAPLPKWRLRRACDFVDANLDQSIRLADVAQAAGLTPMHFAAQFKMATGQRPHAYLLKRRIERAQELMSASDTSLAEVALSVGFQTQSHFTTVFRSIAGTTPNRWRSARMRA